MDTSLILQAPPPRRQGVSSKTSAAEAAPGVLRGAWEDKPAHRVHVAVW